MLGLVVDLKWTFVILILSGYNGHPKLKIYIADLKKKELNLTFSEKARQFR
jgi:hypothetical protein